LLLSDWVSTQAPLHSICPLAQTHWQLVGSWADPLGQVTLAQPQLPFWQVCPLAQACPQPPQLALSSWVFAQPPPQALVPLGHAHWPFWQVWPAGQALPQPPQLAPSPWRSVHRPVPSAALGQQVGVAAGQT
jgi:hypothetical protein